MADRTMKVGDTFPPLRATLKVDATALDLTTADGVDVVLKGPATITGSCTIIDAATGRVEYTWGATDTDTSGSYLVEFIVTWDGAATPPTVERVPNTGTRELVIEDAQS